MNFDPCPKVVSPLGSRIAWLMFLDVANATCKTRHTMREKATALFLAVFVGGIFPAAAAQFWWLAGLLLLGALVLAFGIPDLAVLFFSLNKGGLRLLIPVAPLDGSRIDSARVSRRLQVAKKVLEDSVRGRQSIQVLACSGYRMIGWQRNPGWLYHELMSAAPGTLHLEVLLLDPECESARHRSRNVMQGRSHDAYVAGTRAVLWTLRGLQDVGHSVTVRLYREAPIWQIVVLPQEIFVMSAAENTSTELSPWWILRRNRPYSLAHGIEAVWERRWNLQKGSNATVDVPLHTISRPESDAVIDLPGG